MPFFFISEFCILNVFHSFSLQVACKLFCCLFIAEYKTSFEENVQVLFQFCLSVYLHMQTLLSPSGGLAQGY